MRNGVGAATVSAFINNVAVVAVMMPVILQMSHKIDVNPTRLLIPLSFAAMFGGSMTLIGTSSTLLVSGLIADRGLDPIGMFEVTPLGIALFVVGITYLMVVGQRILPDRPIEETWNEQIDRPEYRLQVRINPGHPGIGRTVGEFFAPDSDSGVVAVFRNGRALTDNLDETPLEPHDVLRVSMSAEDVGRLERDNDVDVLPLRDFADDSPHPLREPLELFRVVIAPGSRLAGKTLRDAAFVDYPTIVVALRRAGKVMVDELVDTPLHGGDVLLIEATRRKRRRLAEDENFIVVSEVDDELCKSHLLIPVLAIFAAIISLAAMGMFQIVVLAVAGCVAMVLIRALSLNDAYQAIDWQVIFLLGGFIPLGTALEKTGAIDMVAGGLVAGLGDYGPLALLAGFYFYFATNFMSDLISNQAIAVLMTPVEIATAVSFHIDPRPFVIAIAFAASDSFSSPVGYHTNVMIYGAGNYRYLDFVKVGLPLNLLFLATAVLVLPMFWSF